MSVAAAGLKEWPYKVKPMSTREIVKAINNTEWQDFRLSLKGLPTQEKLDRLACRRNEKQARAHNGLLTRDEEVRIDNYINALLRGGQLKRVGTKIVVQR